jgi:hypothetical protein
MDANNDRVGESDVRHTPKVAKKNRNKISADLSLYSRPFAVKKQIT